MKYFIQTYGCQMNKSDSERIDAFLSSSGFKKSEKDMADLVIINACSVRQTAIDRIWGQIEQIKRVNKKTRIILTGCVLPDDKKKFKKRNVTFQNITELKKWPSVINKKRANSRKDNCDYLSINPAHTSNFTAYVPIMTGCNNFCSYCAVPYTRGREVSRNPESILQEVNTLIEQGYKEIILLGQNVNSYLGKDKKNKKISFPNLLKKIDSMKGDYWLTFYSSHPKDLSDELIKSFKTCKHILPYLHLALQSGSNKILKKMNRCYTAAHYKSLIKKLRKINPDIAITTDIIVGFPGETKADFNQTAELLDYLKFDMAYISQFSPRPNTRAAKMVDDISKEEKVKREKDLTTILKKYNLAKNKTLIGKTLPVLVEKYDLKKDTLFGHTDKLKGVKINSNLKSSEIKKLIGQFVNVKITHVRPLSIEGELTLKTDETIQKPKKRRTKNKLERKKKTGGTLATLTSRIHTTKNYAGKKST